MAATGHMGGRLWISLLQSASASSCCSSSPGLFSENRRAVPWRIVLAGLALQIALAALLLKAPPLQQFFLALNEALLALERATQAGTSFVFGYLGGAPAAVSKRAVRERTFVLAFRALPLMLVVSALSALLFYWRVLPWLVKRCRCCWKKRWASAARSGCPPRRTSSSAWWKRRCWCGRISRV